MSSLLYVRRIARPDIQSPLLYLPILLRSYHAGKASSVNIAIHRGLRKSNGIGFRNSTKPLANDPREVYRKRNGIPAYEPVTTKNKVGKQKKAGANPWSLRGKQCRKHSPGRPQGGNPILHSENFGESDVRGRYGEKLTPRIQKFVYQESRPGRTPNKERRFDSPGSTSRFGSSHRSSKPQDQSKSQDFNSKDAYPSLSFRERSGSKSQGRNSFDMPSVGRKSKARYSSSATQFSNRSSSDRGQPTHFGTPHPDIPVRFDDKKYPARTSASFEPRSQGLVEGSTGRFSSERPSGSFSDRRAGPKDISSGRSTSESLDSRSSGQMGDSKVGKLGRGVSESHGTSSFEKSVKLDRRANSDVGQPYGQRHHEDSSSNSAPRILQSFNKHIPMSIPYTTPASEFLYGASVVEAAMTSRRTPKRKLYKLYIYTGENRNDVERDSRMERLARKNGIEVVRVGNDGVRLMDKLSSGRPHNGHILEASPLPRLPVTHLGEFKSCRDQEGFEVSVDHQSREEAAVNGTSNFIPTTKSPDGRKPLVLLLDSIVDPGNLGGIIRTASFVGVTAIAISARNSASFTPVVLKASAGASENITLFSVNKPAGFVVDSKAAGWRVYAAVAPSKRNDPSMPASLSTDELQNPLSESPCILMLGSEGEGLRWNLRSKADIDLYIEGSGQSFNVDSLNVSVAAGILCNAFLSKKDAKVAAPGPEEPTAEGLAKLEAASDALF